MATPGTIFKAPFQEILLGDGERLSRAWEWFFREVYNRLAPLGVEESFTLVNNQSTAADVTRARFNKNKVSQVILEYLVQRVTTSTGAQELIESGVLIFVYKPTSDTWAKVSVSEDSPTDAGVTFSITSSGQVQYVTTNITGTASISRLIYRTRTLAGKNASYSTLGVA